jgi:DNA primase
MGARDWYIADVHHVAGNGQADKTYGRVFYTKGKSFVDAVQNAKGKRLAAPYSLRTFAGAPVSTPATATEIRRKLQPEDMNSGPIFKRLRRRGDL